ncbi:MAG: ABC transporter permease, partial [Acinetobacter sp.]
VKSISQQMYLFILGGLGCVFLFAQGGIDLSMAAVVGLCSIIGTQVMQTNVVLGVIVTVLIGVLVGMVNGAIYAFISIPVFIQGLAMNFLINGLLLPLSNGSATIAAPKVLTALKSTELEIIIEIVVLIIVALVYNYTRFGKDCRAIGAGTTSAVQSGVDVTRSKFVAFTISGFTCGIVAVMTLIRTGAASQSTGANFNFNVMMAMVLGGALLSGGNGVKTRHAVIGAALLIILQNGLVLWGVNARIQDIVKGVLFIVMIVATTKFNAKIDR